MLSASCRHRHGSTINDCHTKGVRPGEGYKNDMGTYPWRLAVEAGDINLIGGDANSGNRWRLRRLVLTCGVPRLAQTAGKRLWENT